MITLLIISFLCCIGYAAYMKIRFNVSSISESYYKTGKRYYFWYWTVATALTLLPCWLEVSGEEYQFVAFLSTCTLIIVGCCPDYKKEHSFLHPLFTSFCGALSIVWAALAGVAYIPLIIIISTAVALLLKNKTYIKALRNICHHSYNTILYRISFLFWIEIAAFMSIYISILIKLLWNM